MLTHLKPGDDPTEPLSYFSVSKTQHLFWLKLLTKMWTNYNCGCGLSFKDTGVVCNENLYKYLKKKEYPRPLGHEKIILMQLHGHYLSFCKQPPFWNVVRYLMKNNNSFAVFCDLFKSLNYFSEKLSCLQCPKWPPFWNAARYTRISSFEKTSLRTNKWP